MCAELLSIIGAANVIAWDRWILAASETDRLAALIFRPGPADADVAKTGSRSLARIKNIAQIDKHIA